MMKVPILILKYNKKMFSLYYNLVGVDGNPLSIMGYVTKCMRKEAFTRFAIEQYQERCAKGDYAYLLRESMKMLAMCNEHRKKVKDK